MTLKAELTRSIEVVLAGNHFVAELSTGFEKSLIYRYQLLAFAFDDQSGGILIMSKKKRSGSRSLRFSLSTRLSNYAAFFLVEKKKKRKKKKDRERIFQQRKRQIYARSGINLLGCILSPPSRSESRSFHSGEGIYVRKATNDGSTWRFLLVARHVAILGLWRAVPRVRELPFLKGFSL